MREAKLEEGSVAVNFSSRLDKEASPCGVDGGMVAGWRAYCHAFAMDTGLGPEGSRLTVDRWRSEDSGAEKDLEGLVDGEGADRECARTNLLLERKGLSKELLLLQ